MKILNFLISHLLKISVFFIMLFSLSVNASEKIKKQTIKALYIPLADHYAALVAYDRYRNQMKYADFKIMQMKNWDLLRAYFQEGGADMAFVMSPLAMDMYQEKANFKWIGLMHRDGNAFAVNKFIENEITLSKYRIDRKPMPELATALREIYKKRQQSIQVGVPHILSTHSVVLYRYLKENNLSFSIDKYDGVIVQAIPIAPPKAPAFIKIQSAREIPSAFEQSLPWADVVETKGFGKIAWYSKDVMKWPNGHVECIAIGADNAINTKYKAMQEVMEYIKIGGEDIEKARNSGGAPLAEIVTIVQKYIPTHTSEAIIASLDPKLNVINYKNLDIEKAGMKQIMDYAVEGGILHEKIDIDAFADERFNRNLNSIVK